MTEPSEAADDLVCPKCGAPDSVVACDDLKCPGTAVPRSSLRPAAPSDLRERIARIVNPMAFETPKHPTNDDAFWRGASREAALVKADLILASLPGLDEEAEAPGWHTTGWDRARNSGRILLVWREVSGVKEHVELGWYSDSKVSWVNTYGRPFSGEPDGWAPLQPFRSLKTGSGE